jgi:hypothetical protein
MGWWILWWVLFLVAGLVVYFFHRVGNRTIVVGIVASGIAFYTGSLILDAFPDLRRVLPRALDGWQFGKSVKIDPAAIEARKIIEGDCRDEEIAETARLTRDIQKYRDLRAKNGVLTPEEEAELGRVRNRLGEIEKKKAACVQPLVPSEPRTESRPPTAVAVAAPRQAPVVAPRRNAATIPATPDLAAIRELSAPRVVDGHLRRGIDLNPGEWLNIRAAVRQTCTYWRIEAPERLWLWFEDGRNAGAVLVYEKGQKYDMPPSAIRSETPMAATIILTPLDERSCAGHWAKGGTWQPLPPAREELKGAARVEPIPDSPASR